MLPCCIIWALFPYYVSECEWVSEWVLSAAMGGWYTVRLSKKSYMGLSATNKHSVTMNQTTPSGDIFERFHWRFQVEKRERSHGYLDCRQRCTLSSVQSKCLFGAKKDLMDTNPKRVLLQPLLAAFMPPECSNHDAHMTSCAFLELATHFSYFDENQYIHWKYSSEFSKKASK